jgi:hypothetical protein
MAEASPPSSKTTKIGKIVTVYTLDGKMTKGEIIGANAKMLYIKHESGTFSINQFAIASIFISNEEMQKDKA